MTRRVAQLQSAAVMQLFGTLTTKEEAQSDGRKMRLQQHLINDTVSWKLLAFELHSAEQYVLE